MQIGIYGGTFNPVHLGHVHLLREVLQTGLLDRILVMPDRTPPHKQAPDLIDGEKRFEMLQLATKGMEGVEVSDFELRREGKSYTYMTLRLLRELHPDDQFFADYGSGYAAVFPGMAQLGGNPCPYPAGRRGQGMRVNMIGWKRPQGCLDHTDVLKITPVSRVVDPGAGGSAGRTARLTAWCRKRSPGISGKTVSTGNETIREGRCAHVAAGIDSLGRI